MKLTLFVHKILTAYMLFYYDTIQIFPCEYIKTITFQKTIHFISLNLTDTSHPYSLVPPNINIIFHEIDFLVLKAPIIYLSQSTYAVTYCFNLRIPLAQTLNQINTNSSNRVTVNRCNEENHTFWFSTGGIKRDNCEDRKPPSATKISARCFSATLGRSKSAGRRGVIDVRREGTFSLRKYEYEVQN
ncbi:hypothetical protein AGLY_013775 [Aphis glycines]|uniref:Uncharacterized protein n=1 Tax=Aphis glycines TaxID=307491 RepID=A0A6G0T524_APHGL|nr:hypothetical protein AGLY_013775 [Aphis glycines]